MLLTIYTLLLLLFGSFSGALATVALFRETLAFTLLLYLSGALMILRSVYCLIRSFRRHEKHTPGSLVLSVCEAAGGVLLLVLPTFSARLLFAVLGLYLSFLIGVKLVDMILCVHQHSRRFLLPLVEAGAFTLALLLMVLFPGARRMLLLCVTGAVLSLFGLMNLCDLLCRIVPSPAAKRVFRRVRLTLPSYVAVFVPMRLFASLRREASQTAPRKGDVPELEVWFQLGAGGGAAAAGHCEICYHGRTFTYGNYNYASQRLLRTVGDGMVIRADRERYLRWILSQGKAVLAFGIRLDRESRKSVDTQLARLQQDLCLWQTPMERESPAAPKQGGGYTDYASRVRRDTGAELYRFTGGRYQTYFIPTVNCVSITNFILEQALEGKVVLYGVQTPGAYLDFLQREYESGSGLVTSRCVYAAEDGAQAFA